MSYILYNKYIHKGFPMNEARANEELNIELEYERVKEQRYQDFQEWLNKCPLVVTDYQDYANEFVITFNLEAD